MEKARLLARALSSATVLGWGAEDIRGEKPDGGGTSPRRMHSCHDEAPSDPDTFNMLMTLPYIMMPRDELCAMLREAKEKAEAREQGCVHEKVDNWMKQITPA